jgi:hypothetical protein
MHQVAALEKRWIISRHEPQARQTHKKQKDSLKDPKKDYLYHTMQQEYFYFSKN